MRLIDALDARAAAMWQRTDTANHPCAQIHAYTVHFADADPDEVGSRNGPSARYGLPDLPRCNWELAAAYAVGRLLDVQ